MNDDEITTPDEPTSPDAGGNPAEPGDVDGGQPTPQDQEPNPQGQEGEEGDPKPDGEEDPKKKLDGLEKRFSKMTRARRDAEADAVAQRAERIRVQAELDRLKAERAAKPEPQAQAEEQPPQQEQYENYADYIKALGAYEARQVIKAENERLANENRQRERQEQQQRSERESFERTEKVKEKGLKKYPDFREAVLENTELKITKVMAEALAFEDTGEDVAYYLAQNPKKAAKIAAMNPARQILAIGRLSERIALKAHENKITKAADPIKPVGGSKAPSAVDPARLSDEEWLRQRQTGKRA